MIDQINSVVQDPPEDMKFLKQIVDHWFKESIQATIRNESGEWKLTAVLKN